MPTFIDQHVLSCKLPDGEKWLYCILVSRAGKQGNCWPSQSQLARDCGCSLRTISSRVRQLAIKKFIRCDYTTTDHGLTIIRYHILPFPDVEVHPPRAVQVPRAPRAPTPAQLDPGVAGTQEAPARLPNGSFPDPYAAQHQVMKRRIQEVVAAGHTRATIGQDPSMCSALDLAIAYGMLPDV